MGSWETMVREEGCQQGDRDERVMSDSLHVRLIVGVDICSAGRYVYASNWVTSIGYLSG